MLISFSVQNHLSFRNRSTLSLVKTLERQMPDHVCGTEVSGYKLLKGSVIYGSNAGGKSNFIFSMLAARNCIVDNTLVPQSRAFRLSKERTKPISFEFQFVAGSNAFEYVFSLQDSLVQYERLSLINYNKSARLVFSREIAADGPAIQIDPKIRRSLGSSLANLIELIMVTTPRDSLALTDLAKREAIADNSSALEYFIAPYEWFDEKLDIFRVSSKPSPFDLELMIEDDDDFKNKVQKVLKAVDPSIDHIRLEKYDGEIKSILPNDSFIEHIQSLKEDLKGLLQFERRRYLISKLGDKIEIERIVVVRIGEDGENITFELNEESAGIRRIIDLVPLFLKKRKGRVLIIDELERSLHPRVTQLFHSLHYENPNDNQLIIATHEHYLLSQDFYRRDEIWFVDKNTQGQSHLYSMSDYDNIRFDKDIRKEYLKGTFGAIQDIQPISL